MISITSTDFLRKRPEPLFYKHHRFCFMEPCRKSQGNHKYSIRLPMEYATPKAGDVVQKLDSMRNVLAEKGTKSF